MIRASTDANPGMRYTMIINRAMMIRPISAASRLVRTASSPSCAPTTFERSSSSSSFSPPIRIWLAIRSASSKLVMPDICALPSVSAAWTFGTLIKSPS